MEPYRLSEGLFGVRNFRFRSFSEVWKGRWEDVIAYPKLRGSQLSQDELVERFTLTFEERQLVHGVRKLASRLGLAVLLKTYQTLGRPPRRKLDIPVSVLGHIAQQLGLSEELFLQYRWRDRAWHRHLSMVRKHTRSRPALQADHVSLRQWLAGQGDELASSKELTEAAIRRCRECRIELPTEKELRRIVRAAGRQRVLELCDRVFARIPIGTRDQMLTCLNPATAGTSTYEWMKSAAGKLGTKTILEEVQKLDFIRSVGIDAKRHFPGTSARMLRVLRERARGEDAAQMRRHALPVRVTLMAALFHGRQMEVTDNIVKILLDLIRRVDKKAERELEKQIVRDMKKVFGKNRILYRIAEAVTENPEKRVREVVFPVASEDLLRRLVDEAKHSETKYEVMRAGVAQRKYRSHYRQMVKPVLDALSFGCDNPARRPLLDGIDLVHRYVDTKHTHYPETEQIPESLLTAKERELIFEQCVGEKKAAKHRFEMCVLRKLERALKCKELWVHGAYRFRDPDEDLPTNWAQTRIEHYEQHDLLLDANEFLRPVREELDAALESFHRFLGRSNKDVAIGHPGGGERGVFHVPKLCKRPERPILDEVKGRVLQRWGVLDLLDILVEADRQVRFSRFFSTSGRRHVLSQSEIRTRLLCTLFALGTNLGLSRIHSAAKPTCSYDDLRYFRRRFVTVESLRDANAALVNRILEIRNPEIWGKGTACASDGKYFGAWDQNLMTEWNPHYGRRGVMVYWHVEKNSTCVYSQVQRSSQVAAMIEGLIRHDTEMRLESNFVDSHGQSEVAFAFCRFLRFALMPRLKRVKHEKLYLPDKQAVDRFPRFAGVLARPTRPVDWDLITQQYDEMARHVIALREGTGPVDSILRRFNSYNRSHPTYRAFTEIGKADKTAFLCRYLSRPETRQEIHEGLNVVENWNSCNEFICFARKTELQTNDPVVQEQIVLSLQLLQNSLILANTIMLQNVLEEEGLFDRMEQEDRRALTPLFTLNVNPYGYFDVNFSKPSFLDAA